MIGWECNGEHYINFWIQWCRENVNGTSILKRMIACTVADLPEIGHKGEVDTFGFSAEDIGDVLYDILGRYNSEYSSLVFLSGDNVAVNARFARLISEKIRIDSHGNREYK